MSIKHDNDEFLPINLKHASLHKVIVNRPGTPKLWTIAHENGHKTRKRRVSGHISRTCKGSITLENVHKHEKDEFLGITLKHVSGLKVVVNRPRTPKLCGNNS